MVVIYFRSSDSDPQTTTEAVFTLTKIYFPGNAGGSILPSFLEKLLYVVVPVVGWLGMTYGYDLWFLSWLRQEVKPSKSLHHKYDDN